MRGKHISKKTDYEYMDIHNCSPKTNIYLNRVGITNVLKPVLIERPTRKVALTAKINAYIALPPEQKGVHMSRSAEVINEIVEESILKPAKSLEELCKDISKELLARHEYTDYAETEAEATYFLERRSGSRNNMESYKLLARAIAKRNSKVRKMVGVEVLGMTACPCAMETIRETFMKNKKIDKTPTITHNQRNITTLIIEVPENYDVEANNLIEIVESSLSSPTYEILKKNEEGNMVYAAHLNPKFVEDVVREVLIKVLSFYKNLPDEALVSVKSISEESIHKHDAFAERITTMGELRKNE